MPEKQFREAPNEKVLEVAVLWLAKAAIVPKGLTKTCEYSRYRRNSLSQLLGKTRNAHLM
jgi:hypothetical protein